MASLDIGAAASKTDVTVPTAESSAPEERLTKAAGLTVASALTGGLRDVSIFFALGRTRKTDGFFALFLVTQFLYTIAVGGHLITLGKIATLGRLVRTDFFYRKFAPRLRLMAAVCIAVVLPIMKFRYDQSWVSSAVIAVLSAAVLVTRGQAEFRAYIAISEDLNTASLAVIWQNVLIIAAAVGCWIAGIQMLSVLVAGVALGFAAQAFHLRRWAPGLRVKSQGNLEEYHVLWEVSGRELLWFGGPAVESLLLSFFPGGVASLVIVARRLTVTTPISYAVPLGFRLISGSHDKDQTRSNGAVVVQSVSVLILLALGIAQAVVVGLRVLAFAEHRHWHLGPITRFDLPTLLPLTACITIGSISFALHHALSRYQQALGHERRAFETTAIATGLQLVGVLLGVAFHSVILVGITCSAAWLVASVRDLSFLATWRDLSMDLRLVLTWLPALFLLTSAVVAQVRFTSIGNELMVWLEGCLPLLAYFWAFQQARRRSEGSWI
jgi:hypothetical protein